MEYNDFEKKAQSTGSMLFTLLLGGLIGAAIALLMAPTSGKKTRRMIMNTVDDVQSRGKKMVKEAQDMVVDTASDVTDEVKDRADELKKIGRKVVKDQKANLKHGVKAARDVFK